MKFATLFGLRKRAHRHCWWKEEKNTLMVWSFVFFSFLRETNLCVSLCTLSIFLSLFIYFLLFDELMNTFNVDIWAFFHRSPFTDAVLWVFNFFLRFFSSFRLNLFINLFCSRTFQRHCKVFLHYIKYDYAVFSFFFFGFLAILMMLWGFNSSLTTASFLFNATVTEHKIRCFFPGTWNCVYMWKMMFAKN